MDASPVWHREMPAAPHDDALPAHNALPIQPEFAWLATFRANHLDRSLMITEPPEISCRTPGDHRFPTSGQGRGHALGSTAFDRSSDCVDPCPLADRQQSPVPYPDVYLPVGHTQFSQLRPGHKSVLLPGQPENILGPWRTSGGTFGRELFNRGIHHSKMTENSSKVCSPCNDSATGDRRKYTDRSISMPTRPSGSRRRATHQHSGGV